MIVIIVIVVIIIVVITITQAYRGAVEAFKEAASLPEDAILDLRGNHDAFDVPIRLALMTHALCTTPL